MDGIAKFCDAARMRSPFIHDVEHYPGGKGLSFRHLINLMPPHDRYIETHLGGGAVLRNKRPARENVGIDVDRRVIDRWSRSSRPNVSVLNGCVLDVLPDLRPDEGTLIYADPPYVRSARRTIRYYRHDYDDEDHRRLLALLTVLPSRVIISGYPSPLYDEMLDGWHRTAYRAATHNGVVEEIAWSNFVPGPVLHDYRFVGATFRERESFRRRAGRLACQLRAAGEMELNAALATLGEDRPEALLTAVERLR